MGYWIDLGSVDGICTHFGRCFHDLQLAFVGDNSKLGIGVRLIHGHAKKALRELGWDNADATEMAHEIVGLLPGAALPSFPELLHVAPPAPPRKMPGVEAARVLRAAAPQAVSRPVKAPRSDSNGKDDWIP